ncbi:hypothetical protein NUKP71_44630 [Klebsiella quasipneumoniae]|nr:hypothetical protein NUKP71_44630 [Klebsiella quasipneumoniae]
MVIDVFAEEMLPEGVLALASVLAQSVSNNGKISVNSLLVFINCLSSKVHHEYLRYQRRA